MKRDKNVWIFVGVIIILIIVLLTVRNHNTKNQTGKVVEEQSIVENQGEYVNVLSDGTKVNKSDKLAEAKTIDGLEISNIRLTEKNNVSKILATVKNVSQETKGGYKIKITLLDENNHTLKEIQSYIDPVEPGETVTLNTAATVDFANAYDFIVSKM